MAWCIMADFQIPRLWRFIVLGASRLLVALLHFLDFWIAPILYTGVMYCTSVKINLLYCRSCHPVLRVWIREEYPRSSFWEICISFLVKNTKILWCGSGSRSRKRDLVNTRFGIWDGKIWIRNTVAISVKRSDRFSYPERFFRIRNRPEQKSSGPDRTRVHLSLTFLQN